MKLWYKKKYLEFENNLKLNDSLRKKEKEHYTKSLYKKQYLELEGRLKIEEDKKLSYKNKYYEVLEELDSYKKKESKKKEAEEWEKVKRPGLDVCLYVEGKTDKKYIEMAYQELYNESPNFKILPVWWAELVSTHISSVIAEEITGIHIWILDWDNAWTKNWMMLNHDNQSDIHLKWVKRVKNGIFENKNKIQTSYCALILIPYREDFRDHIFLDFKKGSKEGVIKDKGSDAIEVDDNYQFLVNHRVIWCDTKWDWKPMFYPTFSIEHLLYNDDSKTYFKEYAPYGEEWFKLKISDKNKLSKNIENLNIPRSVRENFKPLFEYIDDIVSEKCG